ncbi:MAG TPA: ATP-binding protein [Caulobacteraceae bacterium]
MARGDRGSGRTAGVPTGGDPLTRGARVERGTAIRVVILGSLLLLAVYTAFAVHRLRDSQARPVHPDLELLSTGSQSLALAVTADMDILKAALAGADRVLQIAPDDPGRAAAVALDAAGGRAKGSAVVLDGEVIGQAGHAALTHWRSSAARALAAGRRTWIGGGAAGDANLYQAVISRAAGGRRVIILAVDPAFLLPPLAKRGMALAALPDGRVLAAEGAGGVSLAPTVREAFAITPADVDPGRPTFGRRPDGMPIELVVLPAAGGAVVVLAAQPVGVAPASEMRDDLVALLAPLAIACALSLLLVIQSRRAATARQAFADSQARFRHAVEAARCGVWEWALDTDEVYLSEVMGAMLGWGGAGVAPGEAVLERIAAEHRERVRVALSSASQRGGFDVSFRVPSRSGGPPTWVDARGQAVDGGPGVEATRIIGVGLDVTEERLAQIRAQAAETRLRDAIESVSEAFVLWDRFGRLVQCNRNFRDFFAIEARVVKPGAPYEQVAEFMRRAIRREIAAVDGEAGIREAELTDGRWLQISERRTADGGRVVTAADITAIKAQEESRRLNEEQLGRAVTSLKRSQRESAELAQKYVAEKLRAESANQAKSDFLANMSHELRTPLNAINGFSEIMLTEMYGSLGDDRYKQYVRDILASGEHLLALIGDILDMSKIEAGKMNLRFEPVAMEEVVDDAVRILADRAHASGLTLLVRLSPLPEIEADYRALKQVLLNLLSNAIKFTPSGGQVAIRAEAFDAEGGAKVRISVEDTGIGIAAEDLARLAKPFEQVESQYAKTRQGTGLGLALSKSLVEMHGGELSLESTPGEGVTARFILPVTHTSAQSGPGAVAA